MELHKIIIWCGICTITLPILFYLCVKFGTMGFYKAKQFIEKEKACCNNPSQEKCDQCQETNMANPHNH